MFCKITEHLSITVPSSQDVSGRDIQVLLPHSRRIQPPNGDLHSAGRGFHLPPMWQYYLREYLMIVSMKSALGTVARSRTTHAALAVTLVFGGGLSEASARGYRHHHHGYHHHFRHHASNASEHASWREANASIAPASFGGHSFSGMASYYGSESGSRTASGARMISSAMTRAHRSLPFGTKLRVSHGGRSVVVTVNDRGPFVRGRVLDLSTGAARAIGLTGVGVGRVTAEVVS